MHLSVCTTFCSPHVDCTFISIRSVTFTLSSLLLILSPSRQQKVQRSDVMFLPEVSVRSSDVVSSSQVFTVVHVLLQYVRAQRQAVLLLLLVAHLPREPQSRSWLRKAVHVSLCAGGPPARLVPQAFTHLRVSQGTGRVVDWAAAVSIKLSLSGITRIMW